MKSISLVLLNLLFLGHVLRFLIAFLDSPLLLFFLRAFDLFVLGLPLIFKLFLHHGLSQSILISFALAHVLILKGELKLGPFVCYQVSE